ncbi:MAG: hypothetical protein RI952_1535 [Bacteroidota bacterium]|jgi:formyltetrahydrofolate synthetase
MSLQASIKSLNASIEALEYSNHCLSEAHTAFRQMIRENHLVHLPKIKRTELEQYHELENIELNDMAYCVHYTTIDYPKSFDIEIKAIAGCKIEEKDYIQLYKIDKEIFDQLLNVVDKYYHDKLFTYQQDHNDRLDELEKQGRF